MNGLHFFLGFIILSCNSSNRFITDDIKTNKIDKRGIFFEEIESRNYHGTHTISIFFDSVTKQYFVAMFKEKLSQEDQKSFIDFEILPKPKEFENFIICSFGEYHPYEVVVGMEYNNSDSISGECDSILHAVIFNATSNEFEKFETDGLYRLNEHYYRKK
jgi:hypothetical protein